MKTRDLMIPDPITISERATIQTAIELMKVNCIRHLPVVDSGCELKGFVTLTDLKQGLIPSMLANVTVKDLMIHDPITVRPDDDIEAAATKIYKHKIGGMPVMEKRRVVGIITESDILRAFIDMMGILTASSRIEIAMEDRPGHLYKALKIIGENDGEVINVAMVSRQSRKLYHLRLSPCRTAPIREALEVSGYDVVQASDS